jgi:hypothetical protein
MYHDQRGTSVFSIALVIISGVAILHVIFVIIAVGRLFIGEIGFVENEHEFGAEYCHDIFGTFVVGILRCDTTQVNDVVPAIGTYDALSYMSAHRD